MAIEYLQKRMPDLKQATRPVKAKTRIIRSDQDEVELLDKWQKEALEIAGERIRDYFSWSWYELLQYLPETRIEPIYAAEITICPRCENHIDWNFEKRMIPVHCGYQLKHVGPIPIVAYSIRRRIEISDHGLSKELETALEDLMDQADTLFVEEADGVVCEQCAWDELEFQRALGLCKISARRREENEYEERSKHNQEAEHESARVSLQTNDEFIP
jgi:hypothetical protein